MSLYEQSRRGTSWHNILRQRNFCHHRRCRWAPENATFMLSDSGPQKPAFIVAIVHLEAGVGAFSIGLLPESTARLPSWSWRPDSARRGVLCCLPIWHEENNLWNEWRFIYQDPVGLKSVFESMTRGYGSRITRSQWKLGDTHIFIDIYNTAAGRPIHYSLELLQYNFSVLARTTTADLFRYWNLIKFWIEQANDSLVENSTARTNTRRNGREFPSAIPTIRKRYALEGFSYGCQGHHDSDWNTPKWYWKRHTMNVNRVNRRILARMSGFCPVSEFFRLAEQNYVRSRDSRTKNLPTKWTWKKSRPPHTTVNSLTVPSN